MIGCFLYSGVALLTLASDVPCQQAINSSITTTHITSSSIVWVWASTCCVAAVSYQTSYVIGGSISDLALKLYTIQ